jgi:hypothetical protein
VANKQVLASSFYYHASFLMPSDALLAKIVVGVDRFVVKGCLEEGPNQAPDTHAQARQWSPCPGTWGACSEWISLHKCRPCRPKWRPCFCIRSIIPRRHAWKVLMQRAFQRYVPALGPAVFVSTYAPANKAGCSSRHVAYWRAIARLKPHRLLEPGRMSVHQHLQVGAACQQLPHHQTRSP